jgi:hypothetical protein
MPRNLRRKNFARNCREFGPFRSGETGQNTNPLKFLTWALSLFYG